MDSTKFENTFKHLFDDDKDELDEAVNFLNLQGLWFEIFVHNMMVPWSLLQWNLR